MKEWNGYYLKTYRHRSGSITGWTYEIYEAIAEKLMFITEGLPKELFDSKISAQIAAKEYITMMKGVQ